MSSTSEPKRTRGPYRSVGRTPRQTLFNRKRRRTASVTTLPTVPHCKEASAAGGNEDFLETDTQLDQESGVTSELADASSPSKLFPGSLLTSSTSHLLISSYANRHHLSSQGKEDLLRLLHLHLPSDNLLPPSLYAFRKISVSSNDITPEPTEHFYCPRCYTPLQTSESTICPNQCCRNSLLPECTPSFTTLSLSLQLQTLLKRKSIIINANYFCQRIEVEIQNFISRIQGIIMDIFYLMCIIDVGPGFFQSLRHSRLTPREPGILADIYDCQLYQALAGHQGPLADEHNISVILNTDGVEVFKSTKLSMWPILLMINELPFTERYVMQS